MGARIPGYVGAPSEAPDLGIIRDNVLAQTNKFATFYEVWEAVAPLVPVSYHTTISLCADG